MSFTARLTENAPRPGLASSAGRGEEESAVAAAAPSRADAQAMARVRCMGGGGGAAPGAGAARADILSSRRLRGPCDPAKAESPGRGALNVVTPAERGRGAG